jgi:uncharacterized protein YqgC (DUF456 family)
VKMSGVLVGDVLGNYGPLVGPLVGLLVGPLVGLPQLVHSLDFPLGPLIGVLCFNGTSLVYLAQSWFHRT